MKDGIDIIFNDKNAMYYRGSNENTLSPLEFKTNAGDPRRAHRLKAKEGSVTVQNKHISVTVYDDGRVEVVKHEQMA